MRILAVTSIITVMAIWNLKSCQNKFSRDWEVKTYSKNGGTFKLTLSTIRLHDPAGKGKYAPYDELQYDLTIEPQAANKESEDKFLLKQAEAQPEIWFVDKEGYPTIEPITIKLHPDEAKTELWKATGSIAYPKELQKARSWFVQFDDKTR